MIHYESNICKVEIPNQEGRKKEKKGNVNLLENSHMKSNDQ